MLHVSDSTGHFILLIIPPPLTPVHTPATGHTTVGDSRHKIRILRQVTAMLVSSGLNKRLGICILRSVYPCRSLVSPRNLPFWEVEMKRSSCVSNPFLSSPLHSSHPVYYGNGGFINPQVHLHLWFTFMCPGRLAIFYWSRFHSVFGTWMEVMERRDCRSRSILLIGNREASR